MGGTAGTEPERRPREARVENRPPGRRSPVPPGLGITTRRTGEGRYVPASALTRLSARPRFCGESICSHNETSRPGMTASPACAGWPLRSTAGLNGTHRLLPAAGPRTARWLRSMRPARATPTPPSHLTFGPSRPIPRPRPVLRPLLTSARSARTSRCEPSARRNDSTTSTQADLPG